MEFFICQGPLLKRSDNVKTSFAMRFSETNLDNLNEGGFYFILYSPSDTKMTRELLEQHRIHEREVKYGTPHHLSNSQMA